MIEVDASETGIKREEIGVALDDEFGGVVRN
jgi:hypothetical protein